MFDYNVVRDRVSDEYTTARARRTSKDDVTTMRNMQTGDDDDQGIKDSAANQELNVGSEKIFEREMRVSDGSEKRGEWPLEAVAPGPK